MQGGSVEKHTKIYVAGAWAEQHRRARPMISKARAAGLVVTHDWTQTEEDVCACGHHRQEHQPFKPAASIRGCTYIVQEADRSSSPTYCSCGAFNGVGTGGDSALTAEKRRAFAFADLRGVLDADVVWLLAADDTNACGSWVELGVAIAARQFRPQKEMVPPVCFPYIVVSGPQWRRTIFTEPMMHNILATFDGWTGPDAVFESDEEALQHVVETSGIDCFDPTTDRLTAVSR
jgi:hypothetical protein